MFLRDAAQAAYHKLSLGYRRSERQISGLDDVQNKLDIIFHKIDQLEIDQDNKIAGIDRDIIAVIDNTNKILRERHHAAPGVLKIIFLVSNLASFDTIRDVISLMYNDSRFSVIVASIHSRLASGDFSGEEDTHLFLEKEKIAHIRLPDDISGLTLLKQINPDLIIRQSQWDSDVQKHYSSQFLNFTNLALISYAMDNIVDSPAVNPLWPCETVDSPMSRLCWRWYKPNVVGVSEKLEEINAINLHNIHEVGSPKTRMLLEAKPTWFRTTTNLKVFWTSHHTIGDDWLKFGIFPYIYGYAPFCKK